MIGPFGLGPKGTTRMRALPMAQALTARGHEVEIFLAPWGNPEDAGREEERGGVKIHNITLPPFGYMGRIMGCPISTIPMTPAWLTHIEIQPKDMNPHWYMLLSLVSTSCHDLHLAYSIYGIQMGSLDSLMDLLPLSGVFMERVIAQPAGLFGACVAFALLGSLTVVVIPHFT